MGVASSDQIVVTYVRKKIDKDCSADLVRRSRTFSATPVLILDKVNKKPMFIGLCVVCGF